MVGVGVTVAHQCESDRTSAPEILPGRGDLLDLGAGLLVDRSVGVEDLQIPPMRGKGSHCNLDLVADLDGMAGVRTVLEQPPLMCAR